MTNAKRRIQPGQSHYNHYIGYLDDVFDDVFKDTNNPSSYPPYNIAKVSDDQYYIELACAGIKKENITVTKDKNRLIVEGTPEKKINDVVYIAKGLANRKFRVNYDLAEFMVVDKITHENGILTINIKRVIPDQMKPIKIDIE